MLYQWTSDLETQNVLIDTQHKMLFDAFNKFLSASSKGNGKDEILETLNFLINYTSKHFADEEQLQRKYQYPDYLRHKKLHEDFKKTVLDLSKQLNEKGESATLVIKLSSTIGNWLRNHIKQEDKRIAQHIKKMETK